mmetsp:Transcript_58492/g.118977  ORF Transcript_58492/g.118977 Transcript_58492/m.118977 type:complete len:319 (+) Transcript_58492:9-965(+)
MTLMAYAQDCGELIGRERDEFREQVKELRRFLFSESLLYFGLVHLVGGVVGRVRAFCRFEFLKPSLQPHLVCVVGSSCDCVGCLKKFRRFGFFQPTLCLCLVHLFRGSVILWWWFRRRMTLVGNSGGRVKDFHRFVEPWSWLRLVHLGSDGVILCGFSGRAAIVGNHCVGCIKAFHRSGSLQPTLCLCLVVHLVCGGVVIVRRFGGKIQPIGKCVVGGKNRGISLRFGLVHIVGGGGVILFEFVGRTKTPVGNWIGRKKRGISLRLHAFVVGFGSTSSSYCWILFIYSCRRCLFCVEGICLDHASIDHATSIIGFDLI